MGEVKPESICLDEGPFLRDVLTQHLAQGRMHDVSGRMIGHDGASTLRIYAKVRRLTQLHLTGNEFANMHM